MATLTINALAPANVDSSWLGAPGVTVNFIAPGYYGPAIGTRISPDANDVAAWELQEASGNLVNSGSGGSDDFQDIGSTPIIRRVSGLVLPYAVGIPNGATLSTTMGAGTDSVIEPPPPVSVSCWVKFFAFNNDGNFRHIIDKLYRAISSGWSSPYTVSGGLGIGLTPGQPTDGAIQSASGTTIAAVGLGTWHHVGATNDGTTCRLYVDGALMSSTPSPPLDYGSHGPWIIGQNPAYSPEAAFSGLLHDIRVANVARPASYFRTIYRTAMGLPLP
jgi:hypothetical protein